MSCAACPHREFPCSGPCGCTLSGRDIREHRAAGYCPGGRFGTGQAPREWADVAPVVARPRPTLRQAATAAAAMLTGRMVELDVRQERQAICRGCDQARRDPAGDELYCGVCGCGVSADVRAIVNLTAYEERLPLWGCKHPRRAQGEGWRR